MGESVQPVTDDWVIRSVMIGSSDHPAVESWKTRSSLMTRYKSLPRRGWDQYPGGRFAPDGGAAGRIGEGVGASRRAVGATGSGGASAGSHYRCRKNCGKRSDCAAILASLAKMRGAERAHLLSQDPEARLMPGRGEKNQIDAALTPAILTRRAGGDRWTPSLIYPVCAPAALLRGRGRRHLPPDRA
jgi:hypothetical protein